MAVLRAMQVALQWEQATMMLGVSQNGYPKMVSVLLVLQEKKQKGVRYF